MGTYNYLFDIENTLSASSRKGGSIVVEDQQNINAAEREIIEVSFGKVTEEAASSAMVAFDFANTNAAAAPETIVVAAPSEAEASKAVVIEAAPVAAEPVVVDSEHVVLTVAGANSGIEEIAEQGTFADSKFLFSLYDDASSIKGGEGNDTLVVIGGTNQVLTGGAGSDTYKVFSELNKGTKITIDQTGAGAKDNDRLQLSQISMNDVTFIKEGKTLTIQHVNGGEIVINNWKGNELEKISFNDGVMKTEDINSVMIDNNVDVTGNDVMKAFMHSLDNTTKTGFAAIDEAVYACSNGLYSNLTDLVNSFKSDCMNYSGSTVAQRKAFLLNYCGINLDNSDTGAITGSDAGSATTKTAHSVVDEGSATLNDFVYDRSKYQVISTYDNSGRALGTTSKTAENVSFYSTNINGVNFYWNESNWNSIPVNKSVLEQIMGGFINSWAEAAMNLIEDSYGISLNESDSKLRNYKYTSGINAIQVVLDYNQNSSTVAKVWYAVGTTGTSSNAQTVYANEVLVINTAYFANSIKDVDGSSANCNVGYLDRVIAHEMVHSVMAATVNSFTKLPVFMKEGLAELVHGVDDTRASELLELTNTKYSGYWTVNGTSTKFNQEDLLNKVFDLTNVNTTVGTDTYAGGYMLLRYMAKQISDYMNANDEAYDSAMLAGYSNEVTTGSSSYSSASSAMLSFGDASSLDSTIDLSSYSQKQDVVAYGTGC